MGSVARSQAPKGPNSIAQGRGSASWVEKSFGSMNAEGVVQTRPIVRGHTAQPLYNLFEVGALAQFSPQGALTRPWAVERNPIGVELTCRAHNLWFDCPGTSG
jgi:hypothetical protein